MPRRLYLDTGISGVMLSRERDSGHSIGLADPRQPHLVRIAYLGVDEAGPVRGVCQIIRPEAPWNGWISDEATGGHGVTTEIAEMRGLPLEAVMEEFYDALDGTDELVAFNIDFHVRVLRKAMIDLGGNFTMPGSVAPFCAMRMAAPFVRKPRVDRKPGFMWPKLVEAYAHFSGGAELPGIDEVGPFENGLAIVEALRVIREGIDTGGGVGMSDEDLQNLIRLLAHTSLTAEVRMPGASFTAGELLTVMREASAYRDQQRSAPR